MRIGDRMRLAVRRNGESRPVTLTVEALPSASAERVALNDLTLITVTPAIAAERRLSAPRGALVLEVGPSWQRTLGLLPGDVILQINNHQISSADQVGTVIDYIRRRGDPRGVVRFFIARGDQVRYADMWGSLL